MFLSGMCPNAQRASVKNTDKKKAKWIDDNAKVYSRLIFQTKCCFCSTLGRFVVPYRQDLVPLKSYSLTTELRAQNVTEIRDLTWQVLSITQENAVDLHRVSTVPKNLATTVGVKMYRCLQKHESVALHDLLSNGHHLLGVSFIRSLKSNLCTAVPIHDTIEMSCIISHTQNITALQPNVLLTGMHLLLVTNKRGTACPAQTTAKVNWKLFS